MTEQLTLIQATRKYLGVPSESLSEFSQQYKRLEPSDKAWLTEAFEAIGVQVVEKN